MRLKYLLKEVTGLKTMYSFSQINLFRQCRKRFKEKYILDMKEESSPAQIFGKTAHSLVKDLTDFNENLFEPEIVQCVKALKENEEFKKYRITNYERCTKGNIGNNPFIAFLDALAIKEEKELAILEFKFVKSLNSWSAEDNILQHSIYQELTGVKNFVYFIVDKCKKTKIKVIENPPRATKEEIMQICQDIEQEFSFNPTAYQDESLKKNCWFCPLRENQCEAYY